MEAGFCPPANFTPTWSSDSPGKRRNRLSKFWRCASALDYCPPVDLTFGEYLRALITADTELVRDDDRGYRVAVIDAFRRRGLYPSGIRSLAPDSLLWTRPDEYPGGCEHLRLCEKWNKRLLAELNSWNLSADRKAMFNYARSLRTELQAWFVAVRDAADIGALEAMTGLALSDKTAKSMRRGPDGKPIFEVHAVWPSRRVGPDGQLMTNLVVELTQERKGFRDPNRQEQSDKGLEGSDVVADFTFRGGCTLILDLETAMPCYFVHKNILSDSRLRLQREFLVSSDKSSLRATYFGASGYDEPFAMLHREG